MLRKILIFMMSDVMLTLVGRGIQYASQIALVLVIPAVLAPDVFLQFSLMMPLASLGMSLVFGWLTNALYRYVFDLFDPENGRVRQTAFIYYGMVSFVFIIISIIGTQTIESIYRILPLLLVAMGLKMSVLRVLNAVSNHLGFFVVNIGFAITTVILIMLCVNGSDGSLEKNLIIYAVLDMLISLVAWRWLGVFKLTPLPVFNLGIATKYFHYGAPFVANALAVWVISLSDRYILTIWESVDSVSSYILSYQLAGNIISIPLAFAATVFYPRILRIDREQGESAALKYTHHLLSYYLKFMAVICIVACAVVMLFVYYVYPDYIFSPLIIILVVVSHMIYGSAHFYNKEFELSGRTLVITKGVAVGAMSNILFNFLLIPFIGVLGAAISTLVSYFIVVWWVYNARTYRLA